MAYMCMTYMCILKKEKVFKDKKKINISYYIKREEKNSNK